MAKKEQILQGLAGFTEPVSPTELAAKLGLRVNSFLNQLKRLVKNQLAARTADGKYYITGLGQNRLTAPTTETTPESSEGYHVSIDIGEDIHIRINYSNKA